MRLVKVGTPGGPVGVSVVVSVVGTVTTLLLFFGVEVEVGPARLRVLLVFVFLHSGTTELVLMLFVVVFFFSSFFC